MLNEDSGNNTSILHWAAGSNTHLQLLDAAWQGKLWWGLQGLGAPVVHKGDWIDFLAPSFGSS